MKQSAQSARRQRSVGSMRSVLRLEALEPRLLLSASPAQEALDVLASPTPGPRSRCSAPPTATRV